MMIRVIKRRSDEATKGVAIRGTTRSSLRRSVAPPLRRFSRTGFSFAEVMFAVVVLGVGFIMIAAIFPVAISQSQASVGETYGVTAAVGGVSAMTQLGVSPASKPGVLNPSAQTTPPATPSDSLRPYWDLTPIPAGHVARALHRFTDPPDAAKWSRIRGNFINSTDGRFAWIPVAYQTTGADVPAAGTDTESRFALIWIVSIQARNRATFDLQDFTPPTGTMPASAAPKLVTITLKQADPAADGADTVTIAANSKEATSIDAPATGAFVLVADDKDKGKLNGSYYRLGNPRTDMGSTNTRVFELDPAKKLAVDEQVANADAFIVGRGYADPSGGNVNFDGPAQDLFMMPPVIIKLPQPQ